MVISTVNHVVYNGDGVTTAWPYTFRIIDATDIKLTIINADGTETPVSADYYVDMVNSTVHYPGYAPGAEPPAEDQPAPVQSGQKLLVYRQLPITQEKDLGEKWPFNVIELGLDKLTMILQQIAGWWDRCLKISAADEAQHPGFDLTFPIEAGKSFRINSTATGFEVTDDPSGYAATAAAAAEAATAALTAALDAKDAAEAAAAQVELQTVTYETVAEVKAANIPAGMTVLTDGYSAVNDGGGAMYYVRTKTGSDVDTNDNFTLDNGLFAERVFGGSFNVANGATGWKVYTSASALGLTYSTMNLDQIYRAMPVYSMVIMYVTQGATDFRRFPLPYYGTSPDFYGKGILYVRKTMTTGQPVVGHCEFRDEARKGKQRKWVSTFVGEYNPDDPQLTDYTWSGWEEISARPMDVPKNPQRCVDEFVEVAESYHGKGISYGSTAAAADNGSIQGFAGSPADMNCKVFVQMAMEGINYYRSKYFNASNPWRYLDSYSWAMHPPADWYEFLNWCWANGWEVDPGIEYGNLQKGDLVFWGKSYDRWGSEPTHGDGDNVSADAQANYEACTYTNGHVSYWKSYRSISHVGIVTGRWVTDGDGNKQPEIIQCTGANMALPLDPTPANGVRYDYIGSLDIDSHSSDYLVMYIRMPMNDSKAFSTIDYDSYVLERNIINSYYHKADLKIKGNGSAVTIDVNTRNLAIYSEIEHHGINTATGADNADTDRVCTGFVPLIGVNITPVLPTGYKVLTYVIYDKDKAFTTISADAKYRRYIISKTDESQTISDAEYNTVKNGLLLYYSGSGALYDRGYGKSISIASSKIGNNVVCRRWQGEYCTSSDGVSWTPLDSGTQDLLESVYLYDGENHIRVINGQDVSIL